VSGVTVETGPVGTDSRSPSPRLRRRVAAFVALTKPRIIELLLVTTVPTMIVAHRGLPSVWLMVATVVGGTLSAGGANTFNMYVDRDIDRLMQRTAGRPLVTGEVEPREALVFGLVIETAAFALLWVAVNLLSALLALAACLFYVFVYTLWLKRTSTQNIVIGGAAGAAPVLIGWAAVTNGLAIEPWILFALIFMWTPPHFWALAIKYAEDYRAASVPMMPSVRSARSTAVQMVLYTVPTVALGTIFGFVADLGWVYQVGATAAGLWFLFETVRLLDDLSTRRAMRVFGVSITYLTVVFAAMAADVLTSSWL